MTGTGRILQCCKRAKVKVDRTSQRIEKLKKKKTK